jgi:hypothetical protein
VDAVHVISHKPGITRTFIKQQHFGQVMPMMTKHDSHSTQLTHKLVLGSLL